MILSILAIVTTGLQLDTKRMTVLVIAHRLSTVRAADRICVMDQGRLLGQGSHEELMVGNALYKEFDQIQFAA